MCFIIKNKIAAFLYISVDENVTSIKEGYVFTAVVSLFVSSVGSSGPVSVYTRWINIIRVSSRVDFR